MNCSSELLIPNERAFSLLIRILIHYSGREERRAAPQDAAACKVFKVFCFTGARMYGVEIAVSLKCCYVI